MFRKANFTLHQLESKLLQCIVIFTRLRGTQRGLSQYTLIRADLSTLNIIKLESRVYDMTLPDDVHRQNEAQEDIRISDLNEFF